VVNPLRIRTDVLNELEYRLLLCYMGQTRQSAKIIERQTAAYRAGQAPVVEALRRLKSETLEMKKALLLGKVDALGELLHQAWRSKKKLDEGISNSHVDRLYRLARSRRRHRREDAGARVVAVTSCCSRASTASIAWRRCFEKHGGQVVPFQFERRGLVTWASGPR